MSAETTLHCAWCDGEGRCPGMTIGSVCPASEELCSDCPPVDYPTDETRCAPCPRRVAGDTSRHRRHELLAVMCRLLHYQQHGDGLTIDSPFAEFAEAWNGELPAEILARYRNDAMFHAQVQRAVALIQEVMR